MIAAAASEMKTARGTPIVSGKVTSRNVARYPPSVAIAAIERSNRPITRQT
jgi:hypothetical protein